MEKVNLSHWIPKGFQASEAIKTLRTNIMFSGTLVRAIGLTSYCASEGKSTVSFQLAASLAYAGKSVILLDTDLRNSMFLHRLQRKQLPGLSHYLSGMMPLQEMIHETDIPHMSVLFAGVQVANASELLGTDIFKELISQLKASYDYVIVDTPPLGQVIDCAVMAPALDGTLIVIDTTHNSYKLERRIYSQLQKSNGRILGVVLNKVDFMDKTSYYGKTYGGAYRTE